MTVRNDFIRDIIDADLEAGRHKQIATRFPPEPNGYLHIGHAKSICLNFGLALAYGGTCNLRFDDTNPTKEDVEYVDAIIRDVRWLGFEPTQILYASDTFGQMYDLAVKLIRDGKAFVCSLNEEQIREYRGTLSEPGRPSPYRERSIAENLDLFERMRKGEFPDGAHVLRAKGDNAAANMKMRDPLLYRIRHAHHHRTGDAWCLYPMYDYAHPLEDAFEAITHSICTLEFENNRELYDWVIEHTGVAAKPHQYEFARLSLDYTLMSKRKLLALVQEGAVSGWDDPRMPTIAGMRRRGYRAEAIRAFCDLIGVAKHNSTVDLGKLEYCVRDDLNHHAPRAMAVLRPLKVVLTNVTAPETLSAPSFPADVVQGASPLVRGTLPSLPNPGMRAIPFGREIAIEREDFQQEPVPGYLRLAPGRTVRLRYGACMTCDEVIRGADGEITELRGHVLDETRGGQNPEGTKVWGVIHWVALEGALPAEVHLYDRLFSVPRPEEGGDVMAHLNPRSLEVLTGCLVEPGVAGAAPGDRFQFERQGYFAVDSVAGAGQLVFNKIVGLSESGQKGKVVVPAPIAPAVAKADGGKAKTRPPKRSRVEYRAEARARDPELALALERFQKLGVAADEADLLTGDRATVALFDATVAACGDARAVPAARMIINDLPRAIGERELSSLPFGGAQLGALVSLVEDGQLSGAGAKDVLARLAERGGDPRELVASLGLTQVSDDDSLATLVDDAIAKNAGKAAEYRAGKTGLLGFFVGAVVKASGGTANAHKVKELLAKKLG